MIAAGRTQQRKRTRRWAGSPLRERSGVGKPICRFCGENLKHVFADLKVSPISNNYLDADDLRYPEPFYPLQVFVCEGCFLVQTPTVVHRESIFNDHYAYFSSYSESWLSHASRYVEAMIERFGYGEKSQVIEIASNDGYLLQYFQRKGVPVLGIEPSANVSAAASVKGIPTLIKFFGVETAQLLVAQGKTADLVVGNNVLGHVSDMNDFVGGLKILLKPQGVITMEFPHLLRFIEANQFDTIYHEHLNYLTFIATQRIFAHHGLKLFDVEELHTHGGSLRIFAAHANDHTKPVTDRVAELATREKEAAFDTIDRYFDFQRQIDQTKRKLLMFLIQAKDNGQHIAAYGAPAKGNTLLNYCGVSTDFVDYTVDRSPYKQGHFLPGTRIPIYSPDKVCETRPDYLLILPWNLKEEIMDQMKVIRTWGGQFVTPIPTVTVYD